MRNTIIGLMNIDPNAMVITDTNIRNDIGDVEELAKSIEEVGMINPVSVRPDGTLLSGERRVVAARLAGLESIPALIIDTDQDPFVYRLEENAHYKRYNNTEIGRFAQSNWNNEAIPGDDRPKALARKMGVSVPHLQRCKDVCDWADNLDDSTRKAMLEYLNKKGSQKAIESIVSVPQKPANIITVSNDEIMMAVAEHSATIIISGPEVDEGLMEFALADVGGLLVTGIKPDKIFEEAIRLNIETSFSVGGIIAIIGKTVEFVVALGKTDGRGRSKFKPAMGYYPSFDALIADNTFEFDKVLDLIGLNISVPGRTIVNAKAQEENN